MDFFVGREEDVKVMKWIPRAISHVTPWATGRCNLRCKYCFIYRLYPQQPSSDMPEDVWKALVEFLWRESKDIQKPNIWWFGGEPLVAFSTVVKPCWEYAYEKGYTDYNPYQKEGKAITWGVTTNATLLTQSVPDIEESDIAEWMVRRNFGFLLSIDGTKRTHDMNRVYPDGRGSFDDVWKGVERLMELNAGFQIRWSVAPNQVKYLFEDLEWYIDRGIYNIAPDPVYEVEWDEESLNEFRNQMRLIRENILDWWKEGKKVILKPVRDGLELAFLFERGITRREWRSRCGLAQGGIGVDINGDIYPCHRFVSSRSVKLGNVKTGWNTRARIEWIKNWIKYPPYSEEGVERCRKCIARGACFGGCLAVNYDMFDDPHVMPKAYCDLKEILIEVFSPLYFEAKRRGMHDFIKAYMGVRY